jgi:hypothetical protein
MGMLNEWTLGFTVTQGNCGQRAGRRDVLNRTY